jgi:hypothetical protein
MSARALLAAMVMPCFAISHAAATQVSDTTVIAIAAPKHAGVATLVEEFTLGRGNTATEYQFTWVILALGRAGRLYVIDSPDGLGSVARLYDSTGTYVRTVARTGAGPGEHVAMAGDAKELPDGRLLVSHARGVLVFSAQGEPLTPWLAAASSGNMGSRILVDPAGVVALYGTRPPSPKSDIPQSQARPIPTLVRFEFDGTILDTVAPPEASFHHLLVRRAQSHPYVPINLSAWSPLGYFVTSNTGSYAVDMRVPRQRPGFVTGRAIWSEGDPVVSIRRHVAPVAIQDRERDDWAQNLTMVARMSSDRRGFTMSADEIPRTKPPVSGLSVDADGRIWVRISQPSRLVPSVEIPSRPPSASETYTIAAAFRWVEPFLFDVYEPTGRYLGQVRLPDGTAHFVSQGETLWAAVKGADDVPAIKRFRIRWAAR